MRIKFQPHILRFLKLFHWKVITYKDLVTIQRLIGTLVTTIFFDVFLLFRVNLSIQLFFPRTSCCFQIYRLGERVVNVVFLLYLWFIWVCWTALASTLALIVAYLLNFCYCCCATFPSSSSLVSLHFFCVSVEYFKHVLYAVLLLPSLAGQNKWIWLGPFE